MTEDYSNGYDVEFHIRYRKKVIPPRCKVPRILEKEDVQTHHIEGVKGHEAPVAMRVHWDEQDKAPTDYRLYHGELFKACNAEDERRTLCPQLLKASFYSQAHPLYAARIFKEAPITKDLPEWSPRYGYCSLDAQIEKVREFTSRYLLIDGRLHEKSGEPQYSVASNLGFGRWWSARICETDGTHNANDSICLQAEAEKIRAEHPEVSETFEGRIEVLIPEAVAEPSRTERTYLENANKLLALFQSTVKAVQGRLCGERERWGENGRESIDPYIPHCEECPLANDSECVVQTLETRAQALKNEAKAIEADLAERRKRGWDPAE